LPVVVWPVLIVIVCLHEAGKGVSIDTVGGRGDFAFMGVALAVTANATAVKLAQHDPSNSKVLTRVTMLAILFCGGTWAAMTGSSGNDEPKDPHFNSVVGLVLLGLTVIACISVAIVEARASRPAGPLVVVATATGAEAGGRTP
jgi:hypothetical protein